ncbi:hypothetical protein OS493_020542 [Desmophyllum pertusum]|uniref:Uncharacterized protein n=1 Tax=Desmophyllum pertusum TaxID=174260 RepID=A0A9X0CQB1_9CNID|nr:hypothetical protein OS493_020542 [Desmophyllum pertusum]
MDERNLCGLLESFRFIPNLWSLNLSRNPLGHAVTSIVQHVINLPKLEVLVINQTGSEEDLNHVKETIEQAKPQLEVLTGLEILLGSSRFTFSQSTSGLLPS